MKAENRKQTPPFYVGQEIVAIRSDNEYNDFKKGDMFRVTSILFMCCQWFVTIGKVFGNEYENSRCRDCGHMLKIIPGTEEPFRATNFAPVFRNYVKMTFKKCAENADVCPN